MEKRTKSFLSKTAPLWMFLLVSIFCALLAAFKVTQKLDYRFYDTMLGWSKPPKAVDNILLVDIGDTALNEYGSWPWTRDILADVMLRLKEMGANTAIFDIEYLTPSSLTVSDNINQVMENACSEGEAQITQGISDFASYIQNGMIPTGETVAASEELIHNTVAPSFENIFRQISNGLNVDNDDYFARCLQFFGNSSLTINMREIQVDVSPEDEDYAAKRFLFANVADSSNLIEAGNEYSLREEKSEEGKDFVPAVHSIISHAAGAGFTNVVVDQDGTRRRVELLNSHGNGLYTGQLAFAPLVRVLGVESMERKPRSLILHGALLPGKTERKDINIPLDNHGRMLINWLREKYEYSFKHLGVQNIKYMDDGENGIFEFLLTLATAAPSDISETGALFTEQAAELAQNYMDILQMKEWLLSLCEGYNIEGNAIGGGISGSDYEQYFQLRKDYFDEVSSFATSLSSLTISDPDLLETVQAFVETVEIYTENDTLMRDYINGAFTIIGNSATASTDLGVTPFWRRYANLGTHANVANTILQEDFIRYVDVWWGFAFVFAFCLAVIISTNSLSAARKSVWGILYLVLPVGILILMMVFFRIYTPVTVPLILAALTYILELAMSFVVTEKDKNTLRRGFASYVAPEVVSEIVKDPALLGLGGVSKRITALFSDVKTFSGFTETVNNVATEDIRAHNELVKAGRESGKILSEEEISVQGAAKGASRLVAYLNDYLGALSDAIMLEHGTIDKYVGDEIVSFFGAPIYDSNHAWNACVAGIRMLQAEAEYNKTHGSELPINPRTGKPFFLRSRVGINTGDMVVGNMGTEKKLNYTVMGNNVNLASRLEGTNKAYDSWIMCSESTWVEADSGEHKDKLVAKMLDCVKVVNVEKPVQIYSIQGLRAEMKPEEIEAAALFNKGMEWYLKGRETPTGEKDKQDFLKAKHYFEEADRCYEGIDSPDKGILSMEKKMIERCDDFFTNGLPVNEKGIVLPWDGVYTMKSK
ncbi:MAG TPA: hypothetical protein DCM57_07945 [Treponema sp.]|nr:hypothetical protein [Treponema sp.]